jgi:rhodanese-related sulfurtransferase
VSTIPEITPPEAQLRHADGAFLLDVRESDEWAAGRANGAHHIRLSELPDRLEELPDNQDILCVCRSGGRSLRAAEFLASAGFSAANVAGGMRAWADAGLELTADGAEPTII